MDGIDDRVTLARAAAGDARAFEAFARRWEAPVYRFLLRVTGSPSTAEEARHLTLVRVYTHASGFRGGSVKTWLFRIAYSVALNLVRDEARATFRALEDAERLVDPSASPDAEVADAEERQRVRLALDRLDEGDRALLWLRVAEGMTFEEVAGALGAPASTLRYRFTRALRRMRRQLRPRIDCGARD